MQILGLVKDYVTGMQKDFREAVKDKSGRSMRSFVDGTRDVD